MMHLIVCFQEECAITQEHHFSKKYLFPELLSSVTPIAFLLTLIDTD